MRLLRAVLAVLFLLVSCGCGYVHFGRRAATLPGDAALATAYADLATQQKMLKQELALARKEGDALRLALERAGGTSGGAASSDLLARLSEATQELATLRANYAKLQRERAAAPVVSATDVDGAALAAENTRLRAALEQARAENATLTTQLTSASARQEHMEAELAQLNTVLLAEKEARTRAEQATGAVRAQLATVLAHGARPDGAATAGSSSIGSALQLAKAPPAGSSPRAELRLAAPASAPRPPASADPERSGDVSGVHVVQTGETLESIARQHFGQPERWHAIYELNRPALDGSGGLRPGMRLQLPPK